MRVLLVDDDTDLCDTMARILGRHGWHVAVAHTVVTARQLLADQPFDAALLDVQLAAERGTELLADARHHRLPCVMLTQSDRQEDVLTAFRGAAMGYILKEEGVEAVLHALRDAMGGRVRASSAVVPHLVRPLRQRALVWATLDAVEIRVDGACLLRLGGEQQVALLFALAQAQGGWVSDADLGTAIWGRARHAQGRNNLNVLIFRIRKAAREAGLGDPLLQKRRGATRLLVDAVLGG